MSTRCFLVSSKKDNHVSLLKSKFGYENNVEIKVSPENMEILSTISASIRMANYRNAEENSIFTEEQLYYQLRQVLKVPYFDMDAECLMLHKIADFITSNLIFERDGEKIANVLRPILFFHKETMKHYK